MNIHRPSSHGWSQPARALRAGPRDLSPKSTRSTGVPWQSIELGVTTAIGYLFDDVGSYFSIS